MSKTSGNARGGRFDHHRGRTPLLRETGRWRTGIFLAVNLLGFAAVNAFWRYVATGRWVHFSPSVYWRDLWAPLGRMFVHPLNLIHHPWMVLVMALLLGLVIFVPVIVAVLYRLRFAWAFVLLVVLLGHAPALAATLAIACYLAGRTPLRSDAPFLALLLGMVPVGVYLYFFALAGTDSVAIQPLQRWVLVAPSVLGLVLAVVAGIIVLALARATRYRPGAVWPVLGVMLACPLTIFYTQVGADVLDYARVVGQAEDQATVFRAASLDAWRRDPTARGLTGEKLLNRIRDDAEARKRSLARECQDFLIRHPQSDRAAEILWLQGKTMSIRVSTPAFQDGRVRYVFSAPLAPSAASWRRLVTDYPGRPQALPAELYLAKLDLQAGQIESADERLRTLPRRLDAVIRDLTARPTERGRLGAVFTPAPAMPGVTRYREARFQAERLAWMIDRNALLEHPRAAEAMGRLLSADPAALTGEAWLAHVSNLAGEYEDTPMGENLKLAVALATSDPSQRIEQLLPLAQQRGDTDAAIEATFELGRLVLEQPSLTHRDGVEPAGEYFDRVIKAPPNPWQTAARQRLAWLRSRPQGDDSEPADAVAASRR